MHKTFLEKLDKPSTQLLLRLTATIIMFAVGGWTLYLNTRWNQLSDVVYRAMNDVSQLRQEVAVLKTESENRNDQLIELRGFIVRVEAKLDAFLLKASGQK